VAAATFPGQIRKQPELFFCKINTSLIDRILKIMQLVGGQGSTAKARSSKVGSVDMVFTKVMPCIYAINSRLNIAPPTRAWVY
jgi:hypothetical protein